MLIKEIVEFLKLEKPVEIQIRTKTKKKVDAYYWGLYSETGELKSHLIRVYGLNPERGLQTIIAHELIHAWQEEKGFSDEIHGWKFRVTAEDIEFNFGIKNIYLPDLDL
jgi:hypothetical protein